MTVTFLIMTNPLFPFPSLPHAIPYYKAGKLSLSLGQNSFGENEIELKDISEKETLREHWKAAKEILCRIKQFEKGGKEVSFSFPRI